jgi:hypothetical protein
MKMVGHQAIDVEDYAEFLLCFSKAFEKEVPILVGEENGLLLVTSRENVIKSAGVFDPELSSQGQLS